MTLADMGAYTLYANSTRLYDYQPDSPYSRSHYILIPGSLADADGTLQLYFQSESWGRRTAEILSGRLNAPPKLLVGPAQDAADAYQISAGVICVLIGICILLILSCMTLYLCRPRELAFLFLSLVALLRIITMAVNLPAHDFSLSMHAYYQIRPLLVTCPVVFHAAMGIYLLRDSLTPGIRRFFTPATVLLLTALALFLQQVSSRNWYHLFQLFLLCRLFPRCFCSLPKKFDRLSASAWRLLCRNRHHLLRVSGQRMPYHSGRFGADQYQHYPFQLYVLSFILPYRHQSASDSTVPRRRTAFPGPFKISVSHPHFSIP